MDTKRIDDFMQVVRERWGKDKDILMVLATRLNIICKGTDEGVYFAHQWEQFEREVKLAEWDSDFIEATIDSSAYRNKGLVDNTYTHQGYGVGLSSASGTGQFTATASAVYQQQLRQAELQKKMYEEQAEYYNAVQNGLSSSGLLGAKACV